MPPTFDTERELQQHGRSLRTLARALLGDGHDADDVTQETWLAALQSPPPHAQSSGGWLQTVVRRLAGRMRRSRRRRAQREAVAAHPEAVVAADDVVGKAELLQRVVEAVKQLPEPYRETVWARYFEELQPAAIAQRDGVPVATVKSRLQRGLAQLRLRLDRDGEGGEWRAGLAMAFGLGGGVRVGAAAAAAGVLLMGTAVKLVVGGVAAAAAVGVLWWATAAAPVAPAGGASGAAPVPVVVADADPAAAPPEQRIEVPAQRVAVAADPDLAHVRGRCVDEAGAPLAGCTARFDASEGNTNRMALQGKVDWQNPGPITSGEDGRFDFAFAPPSGMQFALDLQHDGRVPRTGRWGQIDPAQVIDLGDIAMRHGFAVSGRVVDERGAPVARVGVMLNNLPLPLAPTMGANNSRGGVSGEDGRFCIDVPIPAGTWSLYAGAIGMRVKSPDHVVVTEHGAEPVLVTVCTKASIQGMVVDELGRGVEEVYLEAGEAGSGWGAGWSRADGTFTIFTADAAPRPVHLRVDDPGPCEPSWHDDRLWPWGSRDVRIELKRALTFEVQVFDRATGAPITQYAVSCHHEDAHSNLQTDLRLGGDHPAGRVTVDHVWRGRNLLRVVPIGKEYRPSGQIGFEATDAGIAPMRVELDPLQSAFVRVADPAGTPVAGSKVEVVRKGTGAFDASALALDPRSGDVDLPSDPGRRPHELVSQARTGADGRAEVFALPREPDLAVRVTGAHEPVILDPAVFAPGQELTVVVPESGAIVGTVRLAGFDPTRITVQPRRVDGSTMPWRDRDAGRVQSDCSFALRGLAPATYRLVLEYAAPFHSDHSGDSHLMYLEVEVPDVVVIAGHESRVEIDATALVPATLHGRVLLDGAVPAPARTIVRGEGGAKLGQFLVGADGSFEATGLPPGTYRVGLVIGDFLTGDGDTLMHGDQFSVGSGQRLERTFTFTRRRLKITMLQADGKTPAAGLQLLLAGDGIWKTCTTDAEGVLVLAPVPAGKLQLSPVLERHWLEVEMPAGKTEHAVTLTLPTK